VVNWEVDRVEGQNPKWWHALQVGKQILDASDPGYRYENPLNVQTSTARSYLGSMIAQDSIFSAVVAPLNLDKNCCPFRWLLEGTEHDVREIKGLIGESSRLLYMVAQITHWTIKLTKVGIVSLGQFQAMANQELLII